VVSSVTYDGLMEYFDANPGVAKKILEKGLNAARAREAARKAREAVRKSALTGGGLPARLWKAVMTEAERGLAIRPLPGARGPGEGLERALVDYAPPPPPSLIGPAARDPRRDP